MRSPLRLVLAGVLVLALACTAARTDTTVRPPASTSPAAITAQTHGINTLKHLIFIVQENRSFDHYFGNLPGADGIPTKPTDRSRSACPIPSRADWCVPPYRSSSVEFDGGPHTHLAAVADVERRPDERVHRRTAPDPGRVLDRRQPAEVPRHRPGPGAAPRYEHPRARGHPELLGLRRQLRAPGPHVRPLGWTRPAHCAGVGVVGVVLHAGRSDELSQRADNTRASTPTDGGSRSSRGPTSRSCSTRANVSWGYYVFTGRRARLRRTPDAINCMPRAAEPQAPSLWNPFPSFDTVSDDRATQRTSGRRATSSPRRDGTLPAVSWVIPTHVGERAPAGEVERRRAWYVTYLINQIMQGPDWDSTAIFLTWDDWGGFYDHVTPPTGRRQRLRHPRAPRW